MLESGTKYFFLSILSSALLLYGFSFLYGAAGSTSLGDIKRTLAATGHGPLGTVLFARLALILIFAGLGFRITVVPFHFYAPDVYQGATNPNAGLLAVVPKIAGLVALIRIAVVAMPGLERLGWQLSLVSGHGHDDAGQPAGFVAGQRASAVGLFFDRACRLHADRPGRRVCRRGGGPGRQQF